MHLVLNSNVFALGLAVGVLGLVLLLSLIIAYAYDERTLLFFAAYLVAMVLLVYGGGQLVIGQNWMPSLLLVAGPAMTAGLLQWLLRSRNTHHLDKLLMVLMGVATLGLMGFYVANDAVPTVAGRLSGLTLPLCLAWFAAMVAASLYLGYQSWNTAGPWRWWLLLGHAAGLLLALVFLTGTAQASKAYWPVVLMLLLQSPPVYLSLVWRSRLLNESMLRSAAADVTDPLTGLATTPVLIERLLRIMSRSPNIRQPHVSASSALFLIQVQNWQAMLNELGAEFNEKLLLESALRLRRSIGDNDLAARISGGRFAVVAQGLASPGEVSAMATRLVVSGLRIDSPLLPGVELKFRVIVRPLGFAKPLTLAAAQDWLVSLSARFAAWPSTHRSRSILVADDVDGQAGFHSKPPF